MLKRSKLFVAFVSLAFQLTAQSPKRIALVDVNVVDVENGQLIKNQVVFIQDKLITDIIPMAAKPTLVNCRVIQANGNYVMPGLIDSHLHLFYYIKSNKWEELKLSFKLMLANGITGIREAGPSVYTREMLSIRDSLEKKYFPGPRMYVSGITTTSNLKKLQVAAYSNLVDTFSKMGVDGIKIKFTDLKETKEIIDAAKRSNLKVFGHTANSWRNNPSNIQGDFTMEAIDHGIGGVMHTGGYVPIDNNKLPAGPEPVFSNASTRWEDWWLYFDALWLYADDAAEQHLINNMISKKVWLEPTLTVESHPMSYADLIRKRALQYYFYPDSSLIEGYPTPTGKQLDTARLAFRRKQLFVKKFYDAGGLLLAGTDGSLYGSDLRDELGYLADAGIPAASVIKTVTYNNALALGWLNDMGTVTKGKLANIILLKNNPLENISNVESIQAVFSNGNYYNKKTLDEWLEEIKQRASKEKKQN
ncbi:MAG TPA: amidohydrolase family protein [Chitinophagaceae bacterium]|nr:amidohydrolase family protein [Chitinophagaceae bacterium]